MQLENIMGQANQRPLDSDFFKTAQKKLPESTHLLDLSEHRLHNRLAQSINPSPDLGLKLALHPLDNSGSLRQRPPLARQPGFSVFLSLGGHISIDVPPCQILQILFRTVPTVGQNFPRFLTRLLLNGLDHRLKLLFVVALLRNRLTDDQLKVLFHRDLAIVALHKPIVPLS